MPSEQEALEAMKAAYDALPQRTRDVVYGKLHERVAILTILDQMSRASMERFARDPAFVAQCGGEVPARDPLIDHIRNVIAGCAHTREADRVVVPDAEGRPALVGLSPEERRHFVPSDRA